MAEIRGLVRPSAHTVSLIIPLKLMLPTNNNYGRTAKTINRNAAIMKINTNSH